MDHADDGARTEDAFCSSLVLCHCEHTQLSAQLTLCILYWLWVGEIYVRLHRFRLPTPAVCRVSITFTAAILVRTRSKWSRFRARCVLCSVFLIISRFASLNSAMRYGLDEWHGFNEA